MPISVSESHDDCSHFLELFIYGVSHDMGAPLRHLVQFSSMLQKQTTAKLDEKELLWLSFIIEGGQRIQNMSESLLYLSRLATQRSAPISSNVLELLNDEIAQLKNSPNSRIADAAKTAEFHIQGANVERVLIESDWRTVIREFVKNAILFHPISIDHQVVVSLTIETTYSGIRISIEDNGIGVSEKNWSVITAPFKRFNSQHDYPGLGVGLTYVAYIAQLNDAKLEFGSSTLGGLYVSYYQNLEDLALLQKPASL